MMFAFLLLLLTPRGGRNLFQLLPRWGRWRARLWLGFCTWFGLR
jgi:hypothetical protein